MISDDLIAVASGLLRSLSGRPSRAALDRAVSTAYYALFHALCHLCVDRLVGWRNRSVRYWDSVTPIYRLIDHGAAKRVLLQVAGSKASAPELRRLASVVVELQADRILADHDPQPRFDLGDALHRVALAMRAIADLRPAVERLDRWQARRRAAAHAASPDVDESSSMSADIRPLSADHRRPLAVQLIIRSR